ncbi:MAG: hypothetical protein K2M08_07880 [Anaeroplasmataceae bacterium]|nr:hypothetical protein [Anaeroplasmataceae bacterium]
MYVLELKTGIASEEKGGGEYKYISIGVVINDEIKEIDKFFFDKKKPSDLSLVELSQLENGKNFHFDAELKTEVSKKKTEYTYLSIKVPLDGEMVEVSRHFFKSDSAIKLIAKSEKQYPTASADKK